jgi:hypothetical protein
MKQLNYTNTQNWSNSTRYTIKVPAGIMSLQGDVLASDYIHTVDSPTIGIKMVEPNGGVHGLMPVLLAVFDQVIELLPPINYCRISTLKKLLNVLN